jgi:hypothetical protein
LGFLGVKLTDGFFSALEAAFPRLEHLQLLDLGSKGLVARLAAFCHRATRHLTLELETEPYE